MPDFVPGSRVAPTMVAGQRGVENILAARVAVDMDEEIHSYQVSAAPFTALSKKARKKRIVENPRFDFMMKQEYPRGLELSADSIVGVTTMSVLVGQGARVAKNHVLLNTRTGEVMVCTATPAADVITVVRGIGSTETDALTGDTLVNAFTAYEEGADIGDKKSIKEDGEFNYTQILRTPFSMTRTLMQTRLYGGREELTETQWQGVKHTIDMEYAYFFGRRHTRTGTNHQQRFMGGLNYFIATNRWDVTGVKLTERAFVEMLEEGMKFGDGGRYQGKGTKYLFASARWVTEIEFFAKDRMQTRVLDSVYGLEVTEYRSGQGTVMIVPDPILDEFHPDMAFLVDLNHVRPVRLKGSDTKLLDNRQGPGVDGEDFEYLTECSIQIEEEASHVALSGLA
jgi:hypothetical protein